MSWKKISDNEMELKMNKMVNKDRGRFGHTSIVYKDRIYVFGGEKMYN